QHHVSSLTYSEDFAMRKTTVLLLACILLGGMLTAQLSGQDKKDKAGGKNHTVIMEDNKFKPDKLTIHVGDTVTWVNKGKKKHNATSDDKVGKDLAFDSMDVLPGKSSEPIEFKKEGKIPYLCSYHEEMTGLIVVKGKAKR